MKLKISSFHGEGRDKLFLIYPFLSSKPMTEILCSSALRYFCLNLIQNTFV